MPHRPPEDRIYTIISGVFYIGLGDEFDGANAVFFLAQSALVLMAGRLFRV